MDWLLPYDWAAALSASGIPRTSWGPPGPLPSEPAADNLPDPGAGIVPARAPVTKT